MFLLLLPCLVVFSQFDGAGVLDSQQIQKLKFDFAKFHNPDIASSYGEKKVYSLPQLVHAIDHATPPILNLIQHGSAVVTFMPSSDVHQTSSGTLVDVRPPSLCLDPAPGTQAEMALPLNTCSGVFISKNRVMTAGHCMATMIWSLPNKMVDKKKIAVLMDRETPLVADGSMANTAAYHGSVAGVAKLLYCTYNQTTDVAIVELDGANTDHAIIPRRSSPPHLGESVHLLSTPRGLSLQYATCVEGDPECDQPTIRSITNTWLQSPLDSERGGSGGAVEDDNGRLVGVFSGGAQHSVRLKGAFCDANFKYPATCTGDYVARIDTLPAKYFDETQVLPEVTCDYETGFDYDYPNTCPQLDANAGPAPIVAAAGAPGASPLQ